MNPMNRPLIPNRLFLWLAILAFIFTSVSALAATPAAPANLTAAGVGDIEIQWDAVPNAVSYTVSRGNTSGGPYAILVTGVTNTDFIDFPVTPGVTYYYVVNAVDASDDIGPDSDVYKRQPR